MLSPTALPSEHFMLRMLRPMPQREAWNRRFHLLLEHIKSKNAQQSQITLNNHSKPECDNCSPTGELKSHSGLVKASVRKSLRRGRDSRSLVRRRIAVYDCRHYTTSVVCMHPGRKLSRQCYAI